MWNYLLSGKGNFAADRETGDLIVTMFPGIARPSADNTHKVAQAIAPQARMVYADNDLMVLVHAQALLKTATGEATNYIEADVRDPETILAGAARTLDFSQPVALVMLGTVGQLRTPASSYHLRSTGQVAAFFDGLVPVAPGLVPASAWQRDGTASADAGDVTCCGVTLRQ